MDPSSTTPAIVEHRSTRLRVGLGGVVVLILLGLAVAIVVSASAQSGVSGTVSRPAPTASGSTNRNTTAAHGAVIYIHVFGAVARPGLYLLAEGDRAVDLIAAAGGFTATAEQSAINLARVLVDGEQIAIASVGDPAPGAAGGATGAAGTTGAGAANGATVNLNSADSAALQTLPRVGPALAKRIIDWRTKNGRFTAIEDLLSVTGIGEKTFEQLKALVSI